MNASIGDETVEIDFVLNGKPLRRQVQVRQHLADFLRQEMELTGTHLGCEHGVCGACTVLIDGATARGCLTLAVQAAGRRVDTIEGMSTSGALAELQQEFIARNAAQCGFCRRACCSRPMSWSVTAAVSRAMKSASSSPATCAGVPAITPSSMRSKPC